MRGCHNTRLLFRIWYVTSHPPWNLSVFYIFMFHLGRAGVLWALTFALISIYGIAVCIILYPCYISGEMGITIIFLSPLSYIKILLRDSQSKGLDIDLPSCFSPLLWMKSRRHKTWSDGSTHSPLLHQKCGPAPSSKKEKIVVLDHHCTFVSGTSKIEYCSQLPW